MMAATSSRLHEEGRGMTTNASDHLVTSIDQLAATCGEPFGPAVVKEIDHVNADYRAFIEAAPFCAVATCGPDGLDCTPRGDPPGFVRVQDEKTLLIPDRRGNNRIDTAGTILAGISKGAIGGPEHDRTAPERMKATIY
jgi:predicted pyridoxine 5'-phosphate oxidase superfamily flavin-nucleotide-binding protein